MVIMDKISHIIFLLLFVTVRYYANPEIEGAKPPSQQEIREVDYNTYLRQIEKLKD